MSLSNEKIQEILDGAPDGATHYAQGMHYLSYNSRGNWTRYDPNGIGGFHWFDANEYKFRHTKSFHSLSDLEEIFTLRQRVQELEANDPLISAAPDMCQALREAVEKLSEMSYRTEDALDIARWKAALAKADEVE